MATSKRPSSWRSISRIAFSFGRPASFRKSCSPSVVATSTLLGMRARLSPRSEIATMIGRSALRPSAAAVSVAPSRMRSRSICAGNSLAALLGAASAHSTGTVAPGIIFRSAMSRSSARAASSAWRCGGLFMNSLLCVQVSPFEASRPGFTSTATAAPSGRMQRTSTSRVEEAPLPEEFSAATGPPTRHPRGSSSRLSRARTESSVWFMGRV